MRNAPHIGPYAIVMGALCLALIAFMVVRGDTAGYLIAGVVLIFLVLPAALLLLLNARDRQDD